MLLIIVPPTFKAPVIWPLVVAVTFSLVILELALVFVALLEN